MTRIQDSHDYLFTLRVKVRKNQPLIVIHAWDGQSTGPHGHHRIDVELRMGGRIIFPRGATYCGVNRWTSIDGIEAKELVLALFGMRPCDTGDVYFASYTKEQVAFAEMYGEDIDLEREFRYCDENGSVRS